MYPPLRRVDGIRRHAHISGILYRVPPHDRKAEQEMIPEGEFRVVEDMAGHLGLYGTVPTSIPQIDGHLGDLLATEV